MPEKQKKIYYLTGESLSNVTNTPFLEIAKKLGYDVLLMIDPIDEYMVQHVTKYEEKEMGSLSKEGFDEENKEDDKNNEEEYKDFCKFVKDTLDKEVEKVNISKRLTDSPCILVTTQYGWSANMERIMKAQALQRQQMFDAMKSRKILEINPTHKLIKLIKDRYTNNKEKDEKLVKDLIYLMYETALLNSGFTLEKPNLYASRIYRMMTLGLDVDSSGIEETLSPLENVGNNENIENIENKKVNTEEPLREETKMEEVD